MTEPVFAHLLAEKWNREDRAIGSKPTALNTPMRYSSAHGCSRQMAYAAVAEPTEPWDVASTWVTRLGTLIHEELQAAIAEQYPAAQFEVASQCGDYISGSADGYIPGPGDAPGIVLEIKTVGNYVWEQQTGYGKFKRTEPKGPKEAAIVQAGMNALGIGNVDNLCLITLAKECVSVSKAAKLEITDYDRFCAEWWYTRDEWEPQALEEIERMTQVAAELEDGWLPAPEIVDDDYTRKQITAGSYWTCDYCSFRTTCEADGPAPIKVSISNMTPKETK